MDSDLYTITSGNLYVNDEALVKELITIAAKHSKDVGTLVKVVTAIGESCGVTIALSNTLLTTFALKKAKELKKPKQLSTKMASYHAFRSNIKQDLLRIVPGGQNAAISEINRFTSMIWKAIDNELKDQWANEFNELTTERIEKWNAIFKTTIHSTLEEDTDSMIAAEEEQALTEQVDNENADTLTGIAEEDDVDDTSPAPEKKYKKKRPRASTGTPYGSFYDIMLPHYMELDSISSRSDAKQLVEQVWSTLDEKNSKEWNEIHDKPGDKTIWINLFIKYANYVIKNT